ncbi:MAG: FHA domain-containing protein, partial [Deltaproteobacteria bacterium]
MISKMPAVVPTTSVAVTDGTATEGGKAWLEWRSPTGSGRLVLRGSRVTIGRLEDCKLILEDGQVSRHHATLFLRGGRWHLRDEGSANGTRLNGERIQSCVLNDGDVIRMGTSTLFFHQGEAAEQEVDVTILPDSQSRPEAIQSQRLPPGQFRRPEEINGEAALRREYERLHAAFSFNTYLGRETDQHKLLANILKFGFDMLPAERGAVLVRDAEGAPLMPVLALDRIGERTHMLIPESILRMALDSGQAIITADAVADTRFARAPSVIGQGLRSVICVPLPGKREPAGALYFDTRAGGAFDSNHLQMLCAIAGQAGAALEQARMARQLQREQLNRHRLSRFLPRQLVQQVLREGLDLEKGGR